MMKTKHEFTASYTTRDLIIYALGIGCSVRDDEINYLYEEDPDFTAFPLFPLSLQFRASAFHTAKVVNASSGIVPFPPPIMADDSIPPQIQLVSYEPGPIVHISQKNKIAQIHSNTCPA